MAGLLERERRREGQAHKGLDSKREEEGELRRELGQLFQTVDLLRAGGRGPEERDK